MEYAIVQYHNKQYFIKPNQKFMVLGNLGEVGTKIELEPMLIKSDKLLIGQPKLSERLVAEVVENSKTDKVEIYKYKSKSRYRRHTGHRQESTWIMVLGDEKKVKKEVVTKASKETDKKKVSLK